MELLGKFQNWRWEAVVWKDELIDMKSDVHYFRLLNVFAFLNVLSPTVSPPAGPFHIVELLSCG